jgi:hypothetical protein
LRFTAGPNARLIANAVHDGVITGSDKKLHHNDVLWTRVPSRRRRSNAWRPRIRFVKPTGERGPWRAGS